MEHQALGENRDAVAALGEGLPGSATEMCGGGL